MKKYIRISSIAAVVAVAAAGLCFVTPAKAAKEKKMDSKMESKLSAADKKFLKKAYKGGMEEVENAKMAKEKAKDDATKEVAERMITDHGKANEKLLEIAKEENFDLSKVEAKPASMSGDNIDKDYLTMLKKDHEKDIAMFEKEAGDSGSKEDSDVKKFAKDTLPTLKEHLPMVEDALGKMK
ncbi:MAG: DUF4142 domain-containing protein [Chthoniobacterales bacterium]